MIYILLYERVDAEWTLVNTLTPLPIELRRRRRKRRKTKR